MRVLCVLTLCILTVSSVASASSEASIVPGEMLLQLDPGVNPGVSPGVNPGVSPGVTRRVSPEVDPGVSRGVHPSASPDVDPSLGPSVAPGVEHGRTEVQAVSARIPGVDLLPIKLLSARMGIWLVRYQSPSLSAEEALAAVRGEVGYHAAQFNHRVTLREVHPNDPYFDLQWSLENLGQTGGIPGVDIGAPEAWGMSRGQRTALGDTIVVAIIDSGVELAHPDLHFWKNHLETPNNGIDDDGNGYVDDYDGWNAYLSRGELPLGSHGAHVSGIAAARGSNGIGICGVGWGTAVMPVAGASETEAVVIEAYGYVLEMRALHNETGGSKGAFVVATNASFGIDLGDPEDFPLWCGIYDTLGEVGILSVGATANEDWNIDEVGDMPTACPSDYLITVTNTNHYGVKVGTAGYGATTIDLGAPGTSIYSACVGESYCYKSGTSMAAPHVTGAIALLWSHAAEEYLVQYRNSPGAAVLQMKEYILEGVDPVQSLANTTVSGGRLNVAGALALMPQTTSSVLSDENAGTETPGMLALRTNPTIGSAHLQFERSSVIFSDGGAAYGGPASERASATGGPWRIGVFSSTGRLVRTLAVPESGATVPTIRWDGNDSRGSAAPAGVYYARAFAPSGQTSNTLRILFLR